MQCKNIKCENSHDGTYGSGKFCGRSCANSREFSVETKLKKSKANKQFWQKLSDEEQIKYSEYKNTEEWKQKISLAAHERLLGSDWDYLGWDGKRKRIIIEQDNACNHCKITEWSKKPITLEIDHINGINDDNRRENLEGLCPNCHSVTESWRGRNKPRKNGKQIVSDDELLVALNEYPNIRQALLRVGLAAKGNNYSRAKRLLGP